MKPAWRGRQNYDPSKLLLYTANPGFIIGESMIGVDPLGGAGADTALPADFTSISISSPTTVEDGLFVHREVETCNLTATLPAKVALLDQWLVVKYGTVEIYRGRVADVQWTEAVEVAAAYKPGNTATKTYRVALVATNGEEQLAGMSTPPRTFTNETLAQRVASWTGLSVTTQSPASDLPVGWANAGYDTATVRRIYRATDSLGSLLDTLRGEAKLRNMTFLYQPLFSPQFVLKPNNQWLTGSVSAPLTFTDDPGHTSIAPPVAGDLFTHQGRYVGYSARTVGMDSGLFTNAATIRWGQYDIESPPVDGNPVENTRGPYRASGASARDVTVDLGTLDVAPGSTNAYWLSRAVTGVLPLRARPVPFTKDVTTPLQSIQQLQGTVPGMAMLEHDGQIERVAVLGRQHDITPGKWLVRYTLGPPHLLDRTSDFDPGTPEVHGQVNTGPGAATFEWVVPDYPADVTIYEVVYLGFPSAVLQTSDNILYASDAPIALTPGTVRTVPVSGAGGTSFWVLYTSNTLPGGTNPSPVWREGQPALLGTLP